MEQTTTKELIKVVVVFETSFFKDAFMLFICYGKTRVELLCFFTFSCKSFFSYYQYALYPNLCLLLFRPYFNANVSTFLNVSYFLSYLNYIIRINFAKIIEIYLENLYFEIKYKIVSRRRKIPISLMETQYRN